MRLDKFDHAVLEVWHSKNCRMTTLTTYDRYGSIITKVTGPQAVAVSNSPKLKGKITRRDTYDKDASAWRTRYK